MMPVMERALPELGPVEFRPNRPAPQNTLRLTLSGAVGPDKPINLADIRRQLAGESYDCVEMSITSGGGNSKESIAIFHDLCARPLLIKATAKRFCLSGGLIIFMAAALRVVEPETELLIHPTNLSRNDLPETVTAEILRARADALAEGDAAVVDIFAARTGYDRAFFEAEKNTEDCLSIEAAIDCGIAHEVSGLTQQCDPAWPDVAARLVADRRVYVAPRLLTPSYRAACHAAQFFPGGAG